MKSRREKFIVSCGLILCSATLSIMFTNCSSSEPTNSAPSVSNTPTAGAIDAWSAPVGNLVQGAVIAEGWGDLRLLPAPVNVAGGWTDSAAISSDGLSLYFAYTTYDFSIAVNMGQLVATGPTRAGMLGNNMKNFRANLTSTGWNVGFLPSPVNGDPNVNEGGLGFNLAQSVYAFSRYNSVSNQATIYFSAKQTDGTWSTPLALGAPINLPNCSNDNAFIIGGLTTGVDIYFDSDRTNLACTSGGGKKHIYHVFYNASTASYGSISLVSGINGSAAGDEDDQVFVTQDQQHIYWRGIRSNATGIFTADAVNGSFANVRPIIQPNYFSPFAGKLVYLGEPNLAQTAKGLMLYMICGIATSETGVLQQPHLGVCRSTKAF